MILRPLKLLKLLLTKDINIMKFNKLLKKSSIKIGLLTAGLFVTMLLLLTYSVLSKSEDSFSKIVERVSVEEIPLIQPGKRMKGANILKFTLKGDERLKPLHEEFTENLSESLFSTLLISIGLSFIIGYASSKLFTRPINRLNKGLKKLKENKYKQRLEKTGTEEFDVLVDEFNALAKELSRVEELRKDLVSDTSHEFKTPLTSLRIQLEGIQDGVVKVNKKTITDLLEQVTRLTTLVHTLDEYTKLRGKNSKLEKKDVNIFKLLNKSKNKHKTKIHILNNVDKDLEVKCDKDLIQRVFDNLIENSIKYSKGSKIIISNTAKSISINDNGVGVPAKELKDIYERFYRVDKSRNRKSGGMGLGLAIVKEIVEAHGWSIKSTNVKSGGLKTTISISDLVSVQGSSLKQS
jgi:two-component system sensor histidine kinase BaeS